MLCRLPPKLVTLSGQGVGGLKVRDTGSLGPALGGGRHWLGLQGQASPMCPLPFHPTPAFLLQHRSR